MSVCNWESRWGWGGIVDGGGGQVTVLMRWGVMFGMEIGRWRRGAWRI